MAKPTLVAFTCDSEQSTSAINTSYIHLPPLPRKRSSKFSSIAPSASILSFLATIASSDTAHASPTPPTFLCPSIQHIDHNQPLPQLQKRDASIQNTIVASSSDSTNSARVIRRVPERYERGDDGIWRKVPTYTLYGYTMGCSNGVCGASTTTNPSLDDQIQVGNQSAATSAAAKPLPDPTDLPSGWLQISRVTTSRTTLILSMSLVLASFICFFIIGCLFWRKSLERRRKQSDIESKARRRRRQLERGLTEEEILEITLEQEMKSKQKLWARATARWKAHARQSARQRRSGKRTNSRMSQIQDDSSISLDHTRSRVATSLSSSRSNTSSRRTSIDSTHDPASREDSRPGSLSPNLNVSHSTSSAHSQSSNGPSSPPAYHHRTQIPPIVVSSSSSSRDGHSGFTTPSAQTRSRRPSHTSLGSPISASKSSAESRSQLLSATPLHAHVATDDKALLARLADLASAPPEDASPGGRPHDEPHACVPEWQDEELDDFELHDNPPHQAAGTSLFPPPPSKERLAAAESYQYSLQLEEDMEAAEPEPEPSAPPFEEGSSPPTLGGDNQLVPSAPPLEEDDSSLEYVPDLQASAPQWEPSETAAAQNHDRIPVGSTPVMNTFNSSVASARLASDDANFPSLPGYRP